MLFADLKGSLELLADRDPEEARTLLDPVLDRMMEAVHRYEGTVNQVMGDGIMALFGAPVAHEDHAVRACFAALRMQASVARYGDEVQRSQGVPLQIRVGVHSGDVLVRSIGSDLRMDYSAVGQTTHLASRMEQMAKPGSVLLTADTLSLVRNHVRVRPLGPVPVKGLATPVEVFELTGARHVSSPLRRRTGVPGPFVGRAAQLARLEQALEDVRGGRGHAVAVVGEPGVGKTRLLFELTRSPRLAGWQRLEAAAASYAAGTPYFLLAELLRAYFEVEEGEAPEGARDRVTGKLLALDGGLSPAVPALLSLLEAGSEGREARALEPLRRRGWIHDAVKRVLVREAQRQPLLLVLENLQWLDPDSHAVLDRLLDGLPAVPILMLLSFRPEFQHGWANRSHYTQLRLDPLGPESAGALAGALAGPGPELEPLRALLARRTGGNPFFLEETVRSLVEAGRLVGQRGGYRLAGALHAVQVPASIHALLAARIDRLAPEDKRVLQAAAVVGTDVPFPLLAAIGELEDEPLRRSLGRLEAAELLFERTLFPEPVYGFRHALTQEVAYGSLLHEQRRALHARLVAAIETLYADRLAEWRDRLAHHVVRGELWHKTVTYFRPVTGVETPLLEGSPWWSADYDRALEEAESDLFAGSEFGFFEQQLAAHVQLGQVHHARGDYRRAVEHLRRNMAALEGDLARERFHMPAVVSVLCRAWLAFCLAETGELDEAAALARHARADAEAAADACGRLFAASALGMVALARADVGGAIAALDAGLPSARAGEQANLLPFVAAPLGRALTLAGRLPEALACFAEAEERAERAGLRGGQSRRLTWRAEAELLAGQIAAATATVDRALALARARGERGSEAHALRVQAEIARRQSDPDGARVRYREAEALAVALGMRPLEAECRLGIGAVCRQLERRDEARSELAAALRLFVGLGLDAGRRRAEAELAQWGETPSGV